MLRWSLIQSDGRMWITHFAFYIWLAASYFLVDLSALLKNMFEGWQGVGTRASHWNTALYGWFWDGNEVRNWPKTHPGASKSRNRAAPQTIEQSCSHEVSNASRIRCDLHLQIGRSELWSDKWIYEICATYQRQFRFFSLTVNRKRFNWRLRNSITI